MNLGDLKKKWETSISQLAGALVEDAFTEGRIYERERIGTILKIGSKTADKIVVASRDVPSAPKAEPKKRRKYKKTAPEFRGHATKMCVDEIRKLMSTPNTALTIKEIIRYCGSLGLKSEPVVYLALRSLRDDGFITRIRPGLYQRVQKADADVMRQPF